LGSKISQDAYTNEDLSLLTTLSKQAAIAINNACLYKETQDFNKTLQEKVDEQTKNIKHAYEIEKKAVDAFPEILKAASDWQPAPITSGDKSAEYPATRFHFEGSVGDINKLFFGNGWSLGIPIIPPTPDGLESMLKGTSRRPDEIIAQVPPRHGTLTRRTRSGTCALSLPCPRTDQHRRCSTHARHTPRRFIQRAPWR